MRVLHLYMRCCLSMCRFHVKSVFPRRLAFARARFVKNGTGEALIKQKHIVETALSLHGTQMAPSKLKRGRPKTDWILARLQVHQLNVAMTHKASSSTRSALGNVNFQLLGAHAVSSALQSTSAPPVGSASSPEKTWKGK